MAGTPTLEFTTLQHSGQVQPLTPAAINSTSAVSGTIGRKLVVTPATINSNSTVTATPHARKAVTPATITSTATVSGSVQRRSRIVPATVNSTATVSITAVNVGHPAGPGLLWLFNGGGVTTKTATPTTINSTSTVTATGWRVGRPFFPAQINGVTAVSVATSTAGRGIRGGLINSTSTVTSSISGGHPARSQKRRDQTPVLVLTSTF